MTLSVVAAGSARLSELRVQRCTSVLRRPQCSKCVAVSRPVGRKHKRSETWSPGERFSLRGKHIVARSGAGEVISTEGSDLAIPKTQEADSTAAEALFNCVNILLGCGILTIPYALKEGGWAAFSVLALIGLSTNYTGKVLIKCQDYYLAHPDAQPPTGHNFTLTNGTLETYEDIAEVAFGKKGRELISLILYTELLGTCALFLILQKDHAKLLLEQSGLDFGMSDAALLTLALAVVMPTTWLKDLSALSYVGAAGAFSAIAVTGLLGYFYVTAPGSMPTDFVHLESLPLTFGLMAFVFAGHAVFPTIYHSMKLEERKHFPQIIDTSFLIVAVVCSVIGFTGYSAYGSGALEEVTLNMPSGYLQMIAFALVLISPFTKFALTLEPVAQGVDNFTRKLCLPAPQLLQKRVVRTGLAASTLVLAAKIPFFGIFMAILGSFLTMTVSVLFPCCANLKLHWDEMEDKERAVNFGILGVGLTATVAGTGAAVQSLVGPEVVDSALSFAHNQDAVFKVLVCGAVCDAI